MFDDTKLAQMGTDSEANFGIINPPIYRASTIHFPTVESFNGRFERRFDEVVYGSYGTPTTKALEEVIASLENARGSIILPSGTAAISLSFMSLLKPGDHVLVSDGAYKSTRSFCETFLSKLGVASSYFNPKIGAEIADQFRSETRLVFLESPSSFTFEIQDVPTLAAACQDNGILTAIDNTWASPLYFQPLDHGVDISIQAATKYLSGHSDVMMGTISTRDDEILKLIKDVTIQFGYSVSPADCYLALRGVRTMGVRLRQHQETALKLINWLKDQSEVSEILYPGWPGNPDFDIWRRDFKGASGLFGVILKTRNKASVSRFIEGMKHFKIGASWGGYESLIIPSYPVRSHASPAWEERGSLLRIHAGLEDSRDLIEDLEKGFVRI